jgi:hypothetical protein
MRKLLLAALCCLWGVSAHAAPGDQTTPSFIVPGHVHPLGVCQLSVSSTAVGLSTCSGGIPFGATYALVQNEGTAARWRDDGTPPTASVGMIISSGTATLPSQSGFSTTLSAVQLIAESGTATLDISFYQ